MKFNLQKVLKKIKKTQNELVSEAEHRTKKFDDIHAYKKNRLKRSK